MSPDVSRCPGVSVSLRGRALGSRGSRCEGVFWVRGGLGLGLGAGVAVGSAVLSLSRRQTCLAIY